MLLMEMEMINMDRKVVGNNIDYALVGKYKDQDIFLIQREPEYYLAFGRHTNQEYWLEALNRIARNKPKEFQFEVQLESATMVIDMVDFRPILNNINGIVAILQS